MDWLQQKYVDLLSSRLELFKRKGNTYNFRCPMCGDSAKDKSRARGYIYDYKGDLKYHCHNCSVTMNFESFLKEIEPGLLQEMSLEKVRERRIGTSKFETVPPKKFEYQDSLKMLKTVARLPSKHPCRQFVEQRKIPETFYDKLYYVDEFKAWVNTMIPGKFEANIDEPRLIIPFVSDGKMHAFQGRTLIDSSKKYIMIVTDESVPSLYGFDRLKLNRRRYCVEGPIDSMFLPNCLATGGGDFHTRLVGVDKNDLILVYDNEPHSKYTVQKMMKAIRAGYSISIWPDRISEKDINAMVLAGMSADYVQYVIDQNIVSGVVSGEVAIRRWSKV